MSPESSVWSHILEPYRATDWQQCVLRLRSLVEADPFAIEPRHVLVALHLRLGQPDLAMLQLERLMPLAIGHGDLFTALAIQIQLDRLRPAAGGEERFATIQRRFRVVGVRETGDRTARSGLSAARLLALPAERFARIAEALQLDWLDGDAEVVETPGHTVWVLLHGRVRWRFEGPPGAPLEQRSHTPGAQVTAPGTPADRVRAHPYAEVPSGLLRFEGQWVQELEATGSEASSPSPIAFRDHHDWLDFEDETAVEGTTAAPPDRESTTPSDSTEPAERDLERVVADPVGGTRWPGGRREPLVLDDLVIPNAWDPFTEEARLEDVAERRSRSRAAVAIENGHVALGVEVTSRMRLHGMLTDVSDSGLGMTFRLRDAQHALGALRNSTLGLELRIPGCPPARASGRVRWLELVEARDRVRVGIEFVELDADARAALARVMETAQAPGEAELALDRPRDREGSPDPDTGFRS